MELIRVPALNDNYIWVLADNQQCIIVDPAEAEPVLEIITAQHLTPVAILLTHHHNDHTGGVKGILNKFTSLPVFGPKETENKGATELVEEGDTVIINQFKFQVIALSGHTLGHIGFYQAPYLFCGDTLFSAGCGRIFEGTPEQMWQSIQKIAALPDETLICCAHEYTLSNLKFAHHIWPENEAITQYLQKITQMRDKHQATVPTLLKDEKKINIFLQCDNQQLQKKLEINMQNPPLRAVFTLLRQLKDQF
ncbi:hydroxyacylglutathione hydrolase [Providencia rettgeri]|uniref:Hydroxyacylglutathione hydrolase n=2 Tax=Providencia TaxID=586 RepID=A0ABT9AR84_9GAMM|nr:MULTISPECIES: hydroxyacylglutathione hydrolase [Providencia]MBC8654418.1 hydroxyacylglutathione hydrolase [Providencia vermicola]HCI96090.1 hydroxyacylglutathione hydrolase [Providencia sp.]APC10481.1 Hydroxyacylglutathione hydrolase [Providencia rettgeri]AVL74100.1 hydroxyacylglutathione hydrolase [Providencia rettgeri]EIL1984724.1 hydroxyacylglutathione hydrolase [Providencia rettgeri]